jgi:hypothetical protein
MGFKQSLIEAFEGSEQEWVEFLPDEKDKEKFPEWDSSISYMADGDEPIIVTFDFDKEGDLIYTTAFLDPSAKFCPECGKFHEPEQAQPTKQTEWKN